MFLMKAGTHASFANATGIRRRSRLTISPDAWECAVTSLLRWSEPGTSIRGWCMHLMWVRSHRGSKLSQHDHDGCRDESRVITWEMDKVQDIYCEKKAKMKVCNTYTGINTHNYLSKMVEITCWFDSQGRIELTIGVMSKWKIRVGVTRIRA